MVVQPGLMGHGFAGVFGRARELERLGPVEGCGEADLAVFLLVVL